ncbi:porin family protein [Flavobacterium sp.]|uniref:porin family protein n=1 Tax=Flavobacterium sp. TaxID=239 RepID=UPI0038FBF71A
MKKVLLTAVAVFAFSFANAQEVKFGVKAGLNMASLNGGDSYYGSYGSKAGFHVGGLAEIKINDKFSVQPELLYSLKGADFNYGFGAFGLGTDKLNLSYIDLPIMVKFYPIQHLSAELGPNVAFLMSAKRVQNTTVDVKDDYNSIDYGMNVGAGYELKQGIMFQLRYNIGLSDVSKSPAIGTNYKDKNSVFQVSVGYKF